MKHIISPRDDQYGFLRCECDTKYAAETFDLLIEHGCRVCGKQFQRVSEKTLTKQLIKVLRDAGYSPKQISDFINREKSTR